MIIDNPSNFIKTFIDDLNISLKKVKSNIQLTFTQRVWISFCLMGMIMTNSVCWAKFERASLKKYKVAALSWVFRQAKIPWSYLLTASVNHVLKTYGITEGTLVLDESDYERSKRTKRIYHVHKQKHKPSGGFVNGQNIVLLLLVTDKISFPVGFEFYMPDPALTTWTKENKKLLKEGIPANERPVKPERNPEYPTKVDIALNLLQSFRNNHKKIKIKSILADALYGEAKFLDTASEIFDGEQVVSQLSRNQNIVYRGKKRSLETYFNTINKGVEHTISIRGGKKMKVTFSSARLHVDSHGKKRFVIALKYEGEKKYRYLVATDMSWRTKDIIQAYTLRWLVEVFFEDWKLYEGWAKEAKQLDEDGSRRGLILSLLLDHAFILHPTQITRIENKLPVYTVGSLLRKVQMEALLDFIKSLLEYKNPAKKLKELATMINEVFVLMPSSKHMVGRDLGRLEPTASLKYRKNG